ncbi:betaine-aldehyde dehydrogenase, partial [Streptomyces sp. W16]|nr:betaine-aldehyde dehydrogenase [Streptomyces sp. W16]
MADKTEQQAGKTIHAGGEWLEAVSGATREIIDPADGLSFAVVAEGDEKDTDIAVAAARAAFDGGEGAWPRTPV